MAENSKWFDPSKMEAAKPGKVSLHNKMLPWLYAMAISLFATLIAITFWPVLDRANQLQDQKMKLARDLENEDQIANAQREEIILLKQDASYVEREARDTLNVARHGEIVFRFQPYKSQDIEP